MPTPPTTSTTSTAISTPVERTFGRMDLMATTKEFSRRKDVPTTATVPGSPLLFSQGDDNSEDNMERKPSAAAPLALDDKRVIFRSINGLVARKRGVVKGSNALDPTLPVDSFATVACPHAPRNRKPTFFQDNGSDTPELELTLPENFSGTETYIPEREQSQSPLQVDSTNAQSSQPRSDQSQSTLQDDLPLHTRRIPSLAVKFSLLRASATVTAGLDDLDDDVDWSHALRRRK